MLSVVTAGAGLDKLIAFTSDTAGEHSQALSMLCLSGKPQVRLITTAC